MKTPKPNAYVELTKDAAGYWLMVNGVPVFTGQMRPDPELLRALTDFGPVVMTRKGTPGG